MDRLIISLLKAALVGVAAGVAVTVIGGPICKARAQPGTVVRREDLSAGARERVDRMIARMDENRQKAGIPIPGA